MARLGLWRPRLHRRILAVSATVVVRSFPIGLAKPNPNPERDPRIRETAYEIVITRFWRNVSPPTGGEMRVGGAEMRRACFHVGWGERSVDGITRVGEIVPDDLAASTRPAQRYPPWREADRSCARAFRRQRRISSCSESSLTPAQISARPLHHRHWHSSGFRRSSTTPAKSVDSRRSSAVVYGWMPALGVGH